MTIELDPTGPRPGGETAATAGLRERKKLRTRAALVDAALDLFERQGFEATTVDQIAAAVDVSPRTFFRYFATKEDVALAYKEAQADQILAALRARPESEPMITALRGCVLSLAGRYEENEGDLERLRRSALLTRQSPALLARDLERECAMEERIIAELARRLGVDPQTDLRPRLAVAVSIAVLRAVGDCWTCGEPRPARDLRPMFAEAFALVDAGLDLAPGDVDDAAAAQPATLAARPAASTAAKPAVRPGRTAGR